MEDISVYIQLRLDLVVRGFVCHVLTHNFLYVTNVTYMRLFICSCFSQTVRPSVSVNDHVITT